MRDPLFAVLCGVLATNLVLGCPPDYMAVERYGRIQCNQRIWRDLKFSGGVTRTYPLPRVESEGWTEWKMCLNGTLGPSRRKYQVKLMGQKRPVATVKAMYGRSRQSVIFQEYRESGGRFSRDKQSPDPFPADRKEPFQFTAYVKGDYVQYSLCGKTECYRQRRKIADWNLHAVHLDFQAHISVLDLWCL